MLTREDAQAIYRAGEETVVRVLLDLSAKVEQLTADFAALQAENTALRAECQTLRDRVQTLEEQVAKDSHNSHKPPSSDGLAKPKPKSLRPKSKRSSGGQPGHPGHTLPMADHPDRTLRHAVERCANCGRNLVKQAPDRVERRQVHDLPEPKLEVTEHQAEVKICPCGCVNRAAFPPEAAAPVAGFDETGMRAIGSLHWLHTVSTELLTWYYAHKRRGSVAMDAAGILPEYRGRAIHDFWKSYFNYGCDHALCNSHLLRELTFLWEEQAQQWAKEMIDHLLAIKDEVATADAAGLTALPPTDQERFLKGYERIVKAGYAENPAAPQHGPKRRGRRKQSKARNLLDRFRDHPDSILAFMRDFAVPFDNNQSERDLRMMKLRQKISGTFRSFQALENFCRIRGYVSTARKNDANALEALQRVFLGNPFVPTVNTS